MFTHKAAIPFFHLIAHEFEQCQNTKNADANQPVSSTNENQKWQTKLGGTLAFVLGNTEDVSAFDKARKQTKSKPGDKFLHQSYMDKLAVIQTRVSKKKRELGTEIEEWEKRYFEKNNHLPTYDDLLADPVMKKILNQIKTAKAILKL